ncbi:MAG: hypothetical protein ACI9MC_000694 [Kiritimatiellia bacterium]|jgi:hypothetical protein
MLVDIVRSGSEHALERAHEDAYARASLLRPMLRSRTKEG